MRDLQGHRYARAADGFSKVVDGFPDERALAERARVYLTLCRRELAGRVADPVNAEERLTAATAALNSGDESRAERLAQLVLRDDPRHDLAHYLMAAIQARRGHTDAALSSLGQAVAVSPEVRAQARHDTDFESLRGSDAFHALIAPPAGSASRRARRR